MNFFIKKNATLPFLVLKIIKGEVDDFYEYFDSLSSTTINFSMRDTETKKLKIVNDSCNIEKNENEERDEYLIYYQFKNHHTKLIGRYEAEFNIQENQKKIGLPLKNKLYINVVDSFAANNLSYSSTTATIVSNNCCVTSITQETFFLLTEDNIILATEDGENILWI
jgi:hypothetical protein